jgi:molecular chaperone GrpE
MFDETHKKRKIHIETDEKAALPPSEGDAAGEAAPEEPAETPPEERIVALQMALEAEKDGRLRALAELQNFRRRSQEERAQQLLYANERLMDELLPVLEHFQMACDAAEATEETRIVCKGYEMVLGQLRDVLTRFGMTEIPVEPGTFFDPAVHEAVERVVTEEPCEGTVVRVLRKGYRLHDRVLRPAQVAVAVAPTEEV